MNSKSITAIVILVAAAIGAYFWTQGGSDNNASASAMEINFGNNSYDALKSIEYSAAGQDSFQSIPLEADGLGAGNFVQFTFENGKDVCTYDLRITKVKGDISDRPAVDLCAATFYHFEEDS